MLKRPRKASKPDASAGPGNDLAAALGTTGGDRLSDRTRATVGKGVAALDGRLDALIAKIAASDEYDRDDASHLAWVTRAAAAILTEIRKHDEADRQAGSKLDPAIVLAHLRSLPPEKRAHVCRELQAMDSSESVLG